jgi:hypothetical protein
MTGHIEGVVNRNSEDKREPKKKYWRIHYLDVWKLIVHQEFIAFFLFLHGYMRIIL